MSRTLVLGWVIPALLCSVLAAQVLPRSYPVLPPSTPLIVDRQGTFLAEDSQGEGDLGFWALGLDDNPFLTEALISVEDKRFWRHLGFDVRAAGRALVSTLSGRRQGGSTIAMQVVRLAHPSPRTLVVKAEEAAAAVTMTVAFGRTFVLERYLSTLPQGNRMFGASYASRRYFHKPAADLSMAEAALLAALPQAPGNLNLFDPLGFARARERASLVLRLMEEEGKIGAEDLESTVVELNAMAPPRRELRPTGDLHFIAQALQAERARGHSRYSGPIVSSLDPEIQDAAQGTARRAVANNRRFGAADSAVIVVDPRSAEVLAWANSASYGDSADAGSIDYAQTPRSSGSVLKPFLYAQAMDAGLFSPASVVADLPFTVLSPQGEYRALNFDDDYLGPLLYGRALANSRNIPALRVLEALGIEHFLSLCRTLGLARDDKDALWYGYGLAIGGLAVTLRDVAASYATLVSDGRLRALSFLKDGGSPGPQVLSPASCRSVLRWLSDPQSRAPSFPRGGPLEYSWPVAIKTGTSQGFRDAWAVACTPSAVVAIWIGNHRAEPMNRVAGMVAATYARELMEYLHPLQVEGIDEELFPPPEGSIPVDLCLISGEIAGPACPASSREWIMPDQMPRGSCSVHGRVAVDVKTGERADESTDPADVSIRSYARLPGEYELWGAKRGMVEPGRLRDAVPGSDPLRIDPAGPGNLVTLRVSSPQDGSRYLLDPDIPSSYQTISLEASVSGAPAGVRWLVDGSTFSDAASPYSVRLPLEPGLHRIRVVTLDGRCESEEVSIRVE